LHWNAKSDLAMLFHCSRIRPINQLTGRLFALGGPPNRIQPIRCVNWLGPLIGLTSRLIRTSPINCSPREYRGPKKSACDPVPASALPYRVGLGIWGLPVFHACSLWPALSVAGHSPPAADLAANHHARHLQDVEPWYYRIEG
jgi:hypothetical protein